MSLEEIEISIGLIKINSSFICLKRSKPPYVNNLEFPGGKKKKQETSHHCLIRELKEELDINVIKSKFLSSIKHLYTKKLYKINIYLVHKYTGNIQSNEDREIILYNSRCKHDVLPTHDRVLNLLKTPKILKIITLSNINENLLSNLNLYKFIRLRDISYYNYKKHIHDKLYNINFTGNLIVDYPYNHDWKGKFYGIHYKSNYLEKFSIDEREKSLIYSASCHTDADLEICNRKLFDFILISPILKSSYSSKPIGWKQFSRLSKTSFLPTLALGGMSTIEAHLSQCIKNNGFGLAGIKDI